MLRLKPPKNLQLFTMINPSISCNAGKRDLFAYTTGRYLFNEKLRFEERYVEFNIEALEMVAAKSVGREKVVNTRKLAEGGFNGVFVLTMDDGSEVIAKIPYPLTVPKTLTTESEVATLEFLRTKGIPVPQVFTYSSSSDNAVGTENIVMEKAAGQPLDCRWFELTPKERVRLVTSCIDIERKLFSIPFGSYGSIYYTSTLPPNMRSELYRTSHDGRFCIGPSADYTFWRGKRALHELNRGPWRDPRDYVRSVGQRELEWTSKYGKPLRNDFPHNSIVEGEISPEVYVGLLNKFILMSPHILPEDREHPMNMPTMRHPDLNPSNIFVTDSCEVSSPKDLEKPSLPDDYATLSPQEQSQADELHRRRMLFYLYMVFNGKDNTAHLEALRYPLLSLRQHAVDRAGRQWSGNVITLKGALIRLAENWQQLFTDGMKPTKCPVSFNKAEIKEFYRVEENWLKATVLLQYWKSLLDDPGEDGWVRHESYDTVMKINKELKEEWLAEAEDEEDYKSVDLFWPFQDHEEVD
ncbi:kinase-like domain-containing protein [Aspergillus avenaceus]|uniref:Kinase-like domain-containing protein n=1 Tax=Aspergillus avenaceus TaxID=36643 RepID=A0A5N6TYG0_ASPAV|nr:kinase-like domain-containing protein [Aspergillus avenaceus]